MNVEIILSMAGGLGLFLFGMTVMSESIEKVAGAKLRSILEVFTTNRFTGLIVGIIFTGIIQSSSACTVMVVSFVNSGLMSLYQAAGVIYGANIGTTITSQLVSFNLSEAAPVFLLAGVLTMMLGKGKQNAEKIGEVIVGFGVLFMGLSSMSGSDESVEIAGQPAARRIDGNCADGSYPEFFGNGKYRASYGERRIAWPSHQPVHHPWL